MKFTPLQQKAIDLDGNSLLVSAAAGSGKTAVLTQRVIKLLTDENRHCDADRLMILTYTVSAAAEMRARITNALNALRRENPENTLIKRQLTLLPSATISTIHSMCLEIIHGNFQTLGIDPQSTVAEDNRLMLMKEQALSDFIENLYIRADNDKDIAEVIAYFSRGRDDGALLRALDSGSDKLLCEPFPERYIDFVCTPVTAVFEGAAGGEILAFLKNELDDIESRYAQLIVNTEKNNISKLAEFYLAELDAVRLIKKNIDAGDFDGVRRAAEQMSFERHPSADKKYADQKEIWSVYKDIRTQLKARVGNIIDSYLYTDEKTAVSDRNEFLRIARTYLTLCNELNTILRDQRVNQRLMSFDDIEKYTLTLLVEDCDGDRVIKTELAKRLSDRYVEIIVDEYQDCNRTQDIIFTALSREGKNLFCVGDIKQSIYRFRRAEPDIFLNRADSAVAADRQPLTAPSRLDLNLNFRSHFRILDFVNRVFDTVMTKDRGGIDYKNGHRLAFGGLYADNAPGGANISLVVTDDNRDSRSRAECEADFVAAKIKSIVGHDKIYDTKTGTERKVELDDIAILMRAPRTVGGIFERALERAGIGCINNNPSEKYLDTPEVRNVLAYLQVIDNPYNDIPLITLMYSDYFNFSVNELGEIRAGCRGKLFYDAVLERAAVDMKCRMFIDRLEALREISLTSDVYGVINAIYESSGILMRLSLADDGQAARANLMLLLDFAAQFESTRYRGLFAFINYIVALAEKDNTIPSARLRKSEHCVNILSVHRSKGLEYPVVFLVNTCADIRAFPNGEILLDAKLGIGGYVRDNVLHRDFPDMYRSILSQRNAADNLNEEIRLLYVAMTRACSYLYITGASGVAEAEKSVLTAANINISPSERDIYGNPSFFEWILFSVINTREARPFRAFTGIETKADNETLPFTAEVFVADTDIPDKTETQRAERKTIDEQTVKQLVTRKYEYEQSTLLPSKLSVSEIKKMNSRGVSTKKATPAMPGFIVGEATAADRGNAVHRFLQFCDFGAISDESTFDRERDRLVENEFISVRDAELVERDRILTFLSTDTMKRLTATGTCRKEERFLFTLPAREVTDTDSDDGIIVQGIVDCWYIVDGRAVIVDYKTDSVSDGDALAKRYGVQLDMYARALKEILGVETSEKYIYSFCLEKFISL